MIYETCTDTGSREGRLLFLSFLKPIINGMGHYVVEPETRGSRRMDIVVFYGSQTRVSRPRSISFCLRLSGIYLSKNESKLL